MNILKGTVIVGRKRGKTLGFPTANILLNQDILHGIYISETTLDSLSYPSLTFIGIAETFGETSPLAETYILNFDEDIYGKKITVTLLKKIRHSKKFDSADKLIKQMQKDEQEAKKYFKI